MLPAFEKHRETHSLEVTDVSNESNYLCAAVCMNKDTVSELAEAKCGFCKAQPWLQNSVAEATIDKCSGPAGILDSTVKFNESSMIHGVHNVGNDGDSDSLERRMSVHVTHNKGASVPELFSPQVMPPVNELAMVSVSEPVVKNCGILPPVPSGILVSVCGSRVAIHDLKSEETVFEFTGDHVLPAVPVLSELKVK